MNISTILYTSEKQDRYIPYQLDMWLSLEFLKFDWDLNFGYFANNSAMIYQIFIYLLYLLICLKDQYRDEFWIFCCI